MDRDESSAAKKVLFTTQAVQENREFNARWIGAKERGTKKLGVDSHHETEHVTHQAESRSSSW